MSTPLSWVIGADGEAGGIYGSTNPTTIINSVIWGNDAPSGAQAVDGGDFYMYYSGIEGGTGEIVITNIDIDIGNQTLSASATIFVDARRADTYSTPNIDGDYHLTTFSPVINQADNTLATSYSLTLDIDGDDRILEGTVDMGADESDRCNISFPYTATTADELRLAITCANSNGLSDIINLSNTITLTEADNNDANGYNGLPIISSEITINGNGYTIERSNAITETFRILYVDTTGGDLTLNDVTIRNGSAQGSGNADDGGGIYLVDGDVTLNNSIVEDNVSGLGGGILVGSGAHLTVNDSIVRNNGGPNAWGGGIFITLSSADISGSTISGNFANARGGGIALNGNSNVTISDSIISGNSSDANGGGIDMRFGTVTITNTIISGNSAGADGGGINMWAASANVTLTNVTVAGNSANSGGGIGNVATLTLENSLIAGNDAPSDPQIANTGTVNIDYTGLEDGTSSITGTVVAGSGNINLSSSDTIFVSPEVAASAPTTAGDYHLATYSIVINQGDNTLATNAGLTTDIDGEDRFQESTVDMGADESDRCDISSYTVTTADELRVAIICANAKAASDTITLSGTISLTEIDNVTDGNNGLPSIVTPITIEGAGYTIERNSGSADDFRLFHVGTSGTLQLNEVTLDNGSSDATGGAVYVEGSLKATYSTFSNNTASTHGGAIYNDGTATILYSTLLDNVATSGNGGAINGNSGTLTLFNVTIRNNDAGTDGGGIHVEDGLFLLTHGTLRANTSSGPGASLHTDGGTIFIANTVLANGTGLCQNAGRCHFWWWE